MKTRTKQAVAAGTLAVAGFGAGAAVAVTGVASAASDTGSDGTVQPREDWDPSQSIRPDEHLLSGSTARKVRAAALAKHPGATVQRVETDSEGVYEAHIVTKDGAPLTVQVGKDFKVTGTDDLGHGGFGHHGQFDDDGPGPMGTPPSGNGAGA